MTKDHAPDGAQAFNRYSSKNCTFRASLRGGTWQVTRDYVFYGEYESREAAIEGACLAAVAHEAGGGKARVLGPPRETLIPHLSYARTE
jgi:hypothetical protein